MEEPSKINWHRLIGMAMVDYFSGLPLRVEVEIDLPLRKQILDVLVIREEGEITTRLPDGLEDLGHFNLMTYKSLREPLDDWTLKELTAYYVLYRKNLAASQRADVPEAEFRLYGISTRYPQKLAGEIELAPLQPGVYSTRRGTDDFRIIVLNEIPPEEHNALWNLFSAEPDRVSYGLLHYPRQPVPINSLVFQKLANYYRLEGVAMAYTVEQFIHDAIVENLDKLSPEERLKGLSVDDLFDQIPPEEFLKRLSPEQIEAYLRKFKQGGGEEQAD